MYSGQHQVALILIMVATIVLAGVFYDTWPETAWKAFRRGIQRKELHVVTWSCHHFWLNKYGLRSDFPGA